MDIDRKGRGVQEAKGELVCKKCRDGEEKELEYGERGVQKEERSEGRVAGTVYICHLLLLHAKNAQEEEEQEEEARGATMPPTRAASLNSPIFILKLNFKHSLYSSEMPKSLPLSRV